jgi:uncharacterized protein
MEIVALMFLGWKTIASMLLGMALFKWRVITGDRAGVLQADGGGRVPDRVPSSPSASGGISPAGGTAGIRSSSARNSTTGAPSSSTWDGSARSCCSASRTACRRCEALARLLSRTAFSNYILQTLICSAIFYGNGLGLFGAVTRVQQLLIVLAIWIVQLSISPLWLSHFLYGPLEWLWRSLTYWRRMPIRAGA